MGKNLWLRARAKAYLKPELKMKVVWNIYDSEFMVVKWSLYVKTSSKVHLKTSKSHYLLQKFMLNIYIEYNIGISV